MKKLTKRFIKPFYLFENYGTSKESIGKSRLEKVNANNPLDTIKKCSSNELELLQSLKVKVLIISDATPKYRETKDSQAVILSEHFQSEDVTTTYYQKVDNEDLPLNWVQSDINKPESFPQQQFELVLGRRIICFCDDKKHTCGGIESDLQKALQALQNVANRLSSHPKARAYFNLPFLSPEEMEFHHGLWSEVIKEFNNRNNKLVAIPIITPSEKPFIGVPTNTLYGIKIKNRKL